MAIILVIVLLLIAGQAAGALTRSMSLCTCMAMKRETYSSSPITVVSNGTEACPRSRACLLWPCKVLLPCSIFLFAALAKEAIAVDYERVVVIAGQAAGALTRSMSLCTCMAMKKKTYSSSPITVISNGTEAYPRSRACLLWPCKVPLPCPIFLFAAFPSSLH